MGKQTELDFGFSTQTNPAAIPFISEVEMFNNLMGKSYQNRTTPTIDLKDAQFVIDFIDEELNELKQAVKEGDIVEVLAALLDITYVCLGNGSLVFGLKDKIEAGYAEVQASNMSKICSTLYEAEETVRVRSEQQAEKCHYVKLMDKYVVYRSSDNKVMKSINFKQPNLRQFFTQEELDKDY